MLRIDHLTKTFPNGTAALRDVHLTVDEGEVVSLVGPSGCGKSTLLRILAGLDTDYDGRVRLHGHPVAAGGRDTGILFQEPRLMPWLSVRDNVAFGLRTPRSERRATADALVRQVGLEGFGGALPKELSGGMAQRAALARALATEPALLLLDEPFSALDAFTKMRLQDHVLALAGERCTTMLLVTHDVDEALYLSDRVIVLAGQPGRVQSELIVTSPRPRRRDDEQLVELRGRLLDLLGLDPADRTARAAA